jgi:hypothetical protein
MAEDGQAVQSARLIQTTCHVIARSLCNDVSYPTRAVLAVNFGYNHLVLDTKTDKTLIIELFRIRSHRQLPPVLTRLARQSHSLPSRLQTIPTQYSERQSSLNQSEAFRRPQIQSPPSLNITVACGPPVPALYAGLAARLCRQEGPHRPKNVTIPQR